MRPTDRPACAAPSKLTILASSGGPFSWACEQRLGRPRKRPAQALTTRMSRPRGARNGSVAGCNEAVRAIRLFRLSLGGQIATLLR
jgi:hypothetical protein